MGKPIVADNIIVTGLLSKSQETYNLLYDKVKECMENGEDIEVEITTEEKQKEKQKEEQNDEDVEDENVVEMIREGEKGR